MKFISFVVKTSFLGLLFCWIAIMNASVQAHPGRTDSSGCHTCRTNCSSWGLSSGEYHCHKAKTVAPQPEEPIKSVYGEGGTGYTKPAPEYKTPQNNTEDIKISESKPIETNTNSKNTLDIIEGTNDTDSLSGALIILALVGIGYFIGKRKSSNK